jgi:hypothetical protein
MLQLESLAINKSSFNGQEEKEEDDHECSDDGDNIACCLVCDKCAQAHLDELGWKFFMPISAFHEQSKRVATSEYNAAYYAANRKKIKQHYTANRKKIKLAKLVISSLDDNIGALYNAASVSSVVRWTGLSRGPINKALKGDGLLSLRDGTELYRIREAAPHENLAAGMTEAGEMNWHYSVDVPATWSSDCTDEDVMGALALLFT